MPGDSQPIMKRRRHVCLKQCWFVTFTAPALTTQFCGMLACASLGGECWLLPLLVQIIRPSHPSINPAIPPIHASYPFTQIPGHGACT